MTKVKICGITNLEDALLASRLGADALGFNFYPNSPRYLEPNSAAEIIAQLPDGISKVGVFVNSTTDEVESIVAACHLDSVQLHGDETQVFVDDLRERIDATVMKVFRIGNGFDRATVAGFSADAFLLDADTRDFGGSGSAFDWRFAVEIKEIVPDFYLAGGLTPETVADAIRSVLPYGVDVCSGVEASKRKKDPDKVAAFIRRAKEAR